MDVAHNKRESLELVLGVLALGTRELIPAHMAVLVLVLVVP